MLRALENATGRIGRSLTVHAGGAPAARLWPGRSRPREDAHPELLAETAARSPQEPFRAYLLYAAQRLRATRLDLRASGRSRAPGQAGPAYRHPAEFIADLRLVQRGTRAGGRGPPGVRRAAAPDLAGGDVRVPPRRAGDPPAQRGARPRPARARSGRLPAPGSAAGAPAVGADPRGGRDVPGDGVDPGPVRSCRLPTLRGQLHQVRGRHLGRLRPGPPIRPGRTSRPSSTSSRCSRAGLTWRTRPRCSTTCCSWSRSRRGSRPTGRRMEVMLGYSDSAKELGPVSATLRLFAAQQRLSGLGGGQRRPADPVPRPRRRAGTRRRASRAGGARAAARLGGRRVQGHRAG